MLSFKHLYISDYVWNAAGWARLRQRPLFPEHWRDTAPQSLLFELEDAIYLLMCDAPDTLVKAILHRAESLLEAMQHEDLLETAPGLRYSHRSRADYLRGLTLLTSMRSHTHDAELWKKVAQAYAAGAQELKADDRQVSFEQLRAALHYILGCDYVAADALLCGMSRATHGMLEHQVLTALAAELVGVGPPVYHPSIRERVLSYFELSREPGAAAVNYFNKSILDNFEWALLIGAFIDPGDGRLDTKRAIERVRR